MEKDPRIEMQKWIDSPFLTTEEKLESAEDEELFMSRIYIGYGGLNGRIGMGLNRVNRFTMHQAGLTIAKYAKKKKIKNILIGHDGRETSRMTVEELLKANPKASYIEDAIAAPVFSMAMKDTAYELGVYVTGSHHKAYRTGFMVYDGTGAILGHDDIDLLDSLMDETDPIETYKEKKPQTVNKEEHDFYSGYIVKQKAIGYPDKGISDFKVLIAPVSSDGADIITRLLEEFGVKNYEFSTSCYERDFRMPYHVSDGISEDLEAEMLEGGYDIVIMCDSALNNCSCAVPDNGKARLVSGSEMIMFLLWKKYKDKQAQGRFPKHPVLVSSITVAPMFKKLTDDYGIETIETGIGFRNVAEYMNVLAKEDRSQDFILGAEDNGSMVLNMVTRDKDALSVMLAIITTCASLKAEGRTLLDAIEHIERKTGSFNYSRERYSFEGINGKARMHNILNSLTFDVPTDIGGMKVLSIRDYMKGQGFDIDTYRTYDLEQGKCEMIELILDEGFVVLRPSYTKPVLRVYASALGEDRETADRKLLKIKNAIRHWIAQRT